MLGVVHKILFCYSYTVSISHCAFQNDHLQGKSTSTHNHMGVLGINSKSLSHDAHTLQDIITGDELLSDSYDLKEIDGAVYEADCKKISIGAENIGMATGRKV